MENLVFHYCSIETFFAIISNKTLRLSDVLKSNDNLEVMWTKRILLDMVDSEAISYDNFNEEIKKRISIEEYKERLKEKIEIFFERREIKSKFFAICFSGKKSEDMLSQWRGYGDDGRGVAIGFDESILCKTRKKIMLNNDRTKIEFKKVEYESEKQKDMLREFWREKTDIANEKVKTFEVDFEVWITESFYDLYWKAIFMKSNFFKEENESRIVFEKENAHDFTGKRDKKEDKELVNRMKINEGEVTIRNGNIVEYYDLDISKLLDGFIRKIIIGPKCKVDKEDIQMLMKKYNYTNFDVVLSEGSYVSR